VSAKWTSHADHSRINWGRVRGTDPAGRDLCYGDDIQLGAVLRLAAAAEQIVALLRVLADPVEVARRQAAAAEEQEHRRWVREHYPKITDLIRSRADGLTWPKHRSRHTAWRKLVSRLRLDVLEGPRPTAAEAAGRLAGIDVLAVLRELAGENAGLVCGKYMADVIAANEPGRPAAGPDPEAKHG
jgi:hypothetical protein